MRRSSGDPFMSKRRVSQNAKTRRQLLRRLPCVPVATTEGGAPLTLGQVLAATMSGVGELLGRARGTPAPKINALSLGVLIDPTTRPLPEGWPQTANANQLRLHRP